MARKSRKNVNQKVDTTIVTASYTMTGIYVRLSIENSGKDDDGDSIDNQISICVNLRFLLSYTQKLWIELYSKVVDWLKLYK